ncbi:helix-turn-helix transcriptional regulator [Pectinatus frisingensis]|uniref:helix-turn-helix transcriptional regulator n=1 Tax=Pectinatus frisingensis TaxID=865 RepID=UPI0018C6BC16|nr:helix-turn-helix transcriptional regulator [Pectinatus frisingensis]
MYYNLRKIRKTKGFTCDDMAKKIGLANKSMYSKRELGRTPFSLEEARKISELFNNSIDVIFFKNKVS